MESVNDILSRVVGFPSQVLKPQRRELANKSELNFDESDRFVWSNDPRVQGFNPPPPAICEFCGATLYTKGMSFGRRVIWMPYGPERCTCPEAVAEYERIEAERIAKEEAERRAEENRELQERVNRIIGESGMGQRFLNRTFTTFQVTKQNKKAVQIAKKYANNFADLLPKGGQADPGRNGLFISGPKGTGKTHLAAAIANQLMHQGIPVICMSSLDLLERIKRTFSKGDVDEFSVLSVYKTVPLLIIDDMGKEPATEWAVSTIYNIINGRYESCLPTAITTNYDVKTLVARMTPAVTRDSVTAEATIDRLVEMCNIVILTGSSWRGAPGNPLKNNGEVLRCLKI